MNNRPLVYVAGPLTPHTGSPIEYLSNCRRMLAAGVELIKKGCAPFCPAVDMLLFLNGEWAEEITGPEIKAYSMAFLPRCEAILLMPGWKDSKGAQAEAEVAHVLNIPAFFSVDNLVRFFDSPESE